MKTGTAMVRSLLGGGIEKHPRSVLCVHRGLKAKGSIALVYLALILFSEL